MFEVGGEEAADQESAGGGLVDAAGFEVEEEVFVQAAHACGVASFDVVGFDF